MSVNDFEELRAVSLFRLMTAEEILAIGNILTAKEYPAGSRIFSQGDPGDTMYIIRKGVVAITVASGDSEKEVVRFSPTSFFGEIALFDRLQRTAAACAIEDSLLWEMHRDRFAELISREPYIGTKIMYRMIQDMGRRMRAMDQLV